MEIFTQAGGEMLARWGHYLAGVTWIGLLYYFNFVQVPAMPGIADPAKPEVIKNIATRALWWFRWGAMLTLLTGLSILAFQGGSDVGDRFLFSGADYFKTAPGISISTGILFALIMFINVWLVIWPNQKIVIASTKAVSEGGQADPRAAIAGRKGLIASRSNTFFSITMLWFMGVTSHFSGRFTINPSGDDRLVYWAITVVLTAVVEANALGLIGGPSGPGTKFLEDHKKVLIGGFIFWAIFVILWQGLFA